MPPEPGSEAEASEMLNPGVTGVGVGVTVPPV